MVPVRLMANYASPYGAYYPGAIIQVNEREADELCAGGYAVPLDSLPPAEKSPEALKIIETQGDSVNPAEDAVTAPDAADGESVPPPTPTAIQRKSKGK